MADAEDSAPAVWDPTARNGAGGWVRRRDPATAAPWAGPTEPAPEQTAPAAEPTPPEDGRPAADGDPAQPEDTPVVDPRAAADEQPTTILPPPPGTAPGAGGSATAPGSSPGEATPTRFDPPMGRPHLPTARNLPQVTPPPTEISPQASAPYAASPYQPPQQPPQPQPPTQPAIPVHRPPSYRPPSYGPPPGGPAPYQAPDPAQGQAPDEAQNQAQNQPFPGQQQSRFQQGAYQQGAFQQGAFQQGAPPTIPAGSWPATPPPYSYDQQYPQVSSPDVPVPHQPGRRMNPLLLGALVVVVAALLGVGAVYGLGLGKPKTTPVAHPAVTDSASATPTDSASPTDSPSPTDTPSASDSPTDGAQAQAAAVDQLLDQAVSARAQVSEANSALQACASPASVTNAQSLFTQAAQSRQSMSQQAAALDVSQVPGAAEAMQILSRAWAESAAADTDYASWAGAVANTCVPGQNLPQTASSRDVGSKNSSATADKNAFVAAWNPIATQYGLNTRSGNAI